MRGEGLGFGLRVMDFRVLGVERLGVGAWGSLGFV